METFFSAFAHQKPTWIPWNVLQKRDRGGMKIFWSFGWCLRFSFATRSQCRLCVLSWPLDRVGRTIVLYGKRGFWPSWEISEDVAAASGGKLNNENHFVALCGNVLFVAVRVGGFVAELGTRSTEMFKLRFLDIQKSKLWLRSTYLLATVFRVCQIDETQSK